MENKEWKIWKCEMIWKIWKKGKLKCEMICKIWKKCELKCEMIWKIWKQIVKIYGKYGKKAS